ncbi:MAG: hypothetical protein ACC658_16045, partial [Acidimicrobiia bacterium]
PYPWPSESRCSGGATEWRAELDNTSSLSVGGLGVKSLGALLFADGSASDSGGGGGQVMWVLRVL